MSEWVKSHPYRRMHHPITKKIANVPIDKVQAYLDNGYLMGTGRADRKGKVGACAGKRIMTSPDGVKRYIKIEDIQSFVE